jgi:hypothetical protein
VREIPWLSKPRYQRRSDECQAMREARARRGAT